MKEGEKSMRLDNIDIQLLENNYEEDALKQLDKENVDRIYNYLIDNDVFYAKDIFITSLDLFLLKYEEFVERFENLKKELGENFVDILGEDVSKIDLMYK